MDDQGEARMSEPLQCQSCYGHGYFVNHDGTMTPCDHIQLRWSTTPCVSTPEGPPQHQRTTRVYSRVRIEDFEREE